MESFFRYISYIDLYNNNNKIKNVGFLRWKCQADKHMIEMQIKGAENLYGSFKIEETKTKKTVGNLKIDQGIGNYKNLFSAMELSGDTYLNVEDGQLCIYDIKGFTINIGDENCFYVSINLPIEKQEKLEKQRKTVIDSEIESASENVIIDGIEEKYMQAKTVVPSKSNQQEIFDLKQNNEIKMGVPGRQNREEIVPSRQKDKKEQEFSIENYKKEEIEKKVFEEENKRKTEALLQNNKTMSSIQDRNLKTEEDNIKIIEPLHEDKWQQLSKKYPTVHPFSNDIAFLSIQPEDFIILQKSYQKLVQNSFLLHGFYNYGHLILGKLADEENAPLYIGVPGVYYDREKQAAQMFGFVGFESTEQPVQAGSYGYYMIEVKI